MIESRNYYVEKVDKIRSNIKGLETASLHELALGSTLVLGGLILRDNNLLASALVPLLPVIPNIIAMKELSKKEETETSNVYNSWSEYPELLYRVQKGNVETKKRALEPLLDSNYSFKEISIRTGISEEDLEDIWEIPSATRMEELSKKYASIEDVKGELTPEELKVFLEYSSELLKLTDEIYEAESDYFQGTQDKEKGIRISILNRKKEAAELMYAYYRDLGAYRYSVKKREIYKSQTPRRILR